MDLLFWKRLHEQQIHLALKFPLRALFVGSRGGDRARLSVEQLELRTDIAVELALHCCLEFRYGW